MAVLLKTENGSVFYNEHGTFVWMALMAGANKKGALTQKN